MKGIALEAGVSVTTVSFILNGKAEEKARDLIDMLRNRNVDAYILL